MAPEVQEEMQQEVQHSEYMRPDSSNNSAPSPLICLSIIIGYQANNTAVYVLCCMFALT